MPELSKSALRKREWRARQKLKRYGPEGAKEDHRGRHGKHAKAQANGRWNGKGVMRSSHGYVLIRVGKQHPLSSGHGYAYLHDLVWTAAGRERPKAGELLHHRDEDKGHNSLENLELLSRPDHGRLHAISRDRDELGRFLWAANADAAEET